MKPTGWVWGPAAARSVRAGVGHQTGLGKALVCASLSFSAQRGGGNNTCPVVKGFKVCDMPEEEKALTNVPCVVITGQEPP